MSVIFFAASKNFSITEQTNIKVFFPRLKRISVIYGTIALSFLAPDVHPRNILKAESSEIKRDAR